MTNFHKVLIASVFFSIFANSCISQNAYKICMDKKNLIVGNDFYKDVKEVEEKLLEIGVLDNKQRKGYIDAFNSLLDEKNEKWKEVYTEIKSQNPNLDVYRSSFFLTCTVIDTNKKVDCSPTNVQKFFFKQMNYKGFKDDDLIDGLFVFTNFENEILRLNITYLLLTNLMVNY